MIVDGLKVADKAAVFAFFKDESAWCSRSLELYPHLTALDNICLAPMVVLNRKRQEAEARARTLLEPA